MYLLIPEKTGIIWDWFLHVYCCKSIVKSEPCKKGISINMIFQYHRSYVWLYYFITNKCTWWMLDQSVYGEQSPYIKTGWCNVHLFLFWFHTTHSIREKQYQYKQWAIDHKSSARYVISKAYMISTLEYLPIYHIK